MRADWPRRAGILLHPSSLATPHGSVPTGIGDIGSAARMFLDWLDASEQRIWQLLPLSVVDGSGCPYASESAFAHEPLLLSLEDLVADELLTKEEISAGGGGYAASVDWPAVRRRKGAVLSQAASRCAAVIDVERYERENPELSTWALYHALESEQGISWVHWPELLRARDPSALASARERLDPVIRRALALQWLFDRQWAQLRAHAASKGIELWGDVPIFVGATCADVWARPELWRLDDNRVPAVVSGVPPDAFSEEGQMWGHPLYDNAAHKSSDYAWWIARLARALSAVDRVRIDHFRGFQAVWEIPATARDAREGRWVEGLGRELLSALEHSFPSMPFLAEDLGVITDDVRALRDDYGLPGMAILQFAFGGPSGDPKTHNHPYLPHSHRPHQLCYTGTHDNDTLVGWLRSVNQETRSHARYYLGTGSDEGIVDAMMRAAWRSVCCTAILPLQDLLQLGSEARMNVPGRVEGNWSWRLSSSDLLERRLSVRLAAETRLSGRSRTA